MLPYFLVFIIAIFLAVLSDRFFLKNKKLSIMFAILSIVMLSIFAGIRDFSVGTDVIDNSVYRFGRELSSDTFFGKIDTYNHFEYGYSFLNFVVSRFTNDFHVFLFVHQLILSIVVYVIAYREKREHGTKIWLSVMTYLFLWFNTSFNIMKQSIALFIQLFAYKYLEKGECKKYLLFTLVAALFHTSSIIFVTMPILRRIYKNNQGFGKIAVSTVLTLILFIFSSSIFSLAAQILPGLQRYELYFDYESTNLNFRYLIYKIAMCAVLLIFDRLPRKTKNESGLADTNLLSMLSVFDVIFYSLSGFIMYGYRMSYFFLVHNIIFIPRIEANLKSGKNKKLFIIIIILLFIGYWINRFVLSHYDGTIPYIIGV